MIQGKSNRLTCVVCRITAKRTWSWLAHSYHSVSDIIRLKHHSSECVPSDE